MELAARGSLVWMTFGWHYQYADPLSYDDQKQVSAHQSTRDIIDAAVCRDVDGRDAMSDGVSLSKV